MKTSAIRTLIWCFLAAVVLAQPHRAGPATADALDPRWRELPHAKTVFEAPQYETLEAWTERRKQLQKQILWAAGLWPMPERTR